MKHPFKAAASVLATGAVSFVLSNLLPWGYNFTGFDKHHGYGYPLFTVLGLLVPTVAVILVAFFLVYGLFTSGEGSGVKVVFLNASNDDDEDSGLRIFEPEDRETPPPTAFFNGPDVDDL